MSSRKKEWSEEEQRLLFELHRQYGNKWAIIATKIPEKNDSCIKNKFYSTLRKGLRKINNYITNVKKKEDPVKFKALKSFPELFLTKLIAVVDHNYGQKFEVKSKALEVAPNIQARIIELACSEKQYLKRQWKDYQQEEQLLADIHEFNKNCKKRKGKRKQQEDKDIFSENQLGQRQQQSMEVESVQQQKRQMSFQPTIQRTFQKPCDQHLTKKSVASQDIKSQVFKSQDCTGSFGNSFVDHINKKSSVTTTATSRVITNDNPFFASRAQEFFKVLEDNSLSQLSQSNNLSVSGAWAHHESTSGDLSKRPSYMFHPSPLPSDSLSPFNFSNPSSFKNFSNSFEDRGNSFDLFASGRLAMTKKEDNVMSLLDHIPLYEVNTNNFLVKSSDLNKSTDLTPSSFDEQNNDSLTKSISMESKPEHRLNKFLSDYKGFTDMTMIGNAFSDRMKNYNFGDSDMVCNRAIFSESKDDKS